MTQEDALKIFKCLSDASRLNIVQTLARGEMYTEVMAERLGRAHPLFLGGLSMVASTVLMASDLDFEANVRGIIAD